ncbi:MAG: c-type cytochrome [Microscillaceae bacterium]
MMLAQCRNFSQKLAIFTLALLFAFRLQAQDTPTDSGSAAAPDGGAAAASAKPDEATFNKGKALWEGNCTTCHALTDEVVVGPGMYGILGRRDKAWLKPWIKNSQAVIASGDAYAVALYNKYNQTVMTSFAFSDEELDALIDYIAYESEVAMKQKDAPVADTGTAVPGQPADAGASSGYFNLLLGILVFVLVLILAVLLLMISILTRFLNSKEDLAEEDKEVINQRTNVGSLFTSRPVLGGVALIFLLVILKGGWDSLVDVGVQQGYAPTQPIAFSHKLHAGEYQIDCGYCHTGVYKGKSAVIPSANICMNCHNQVKIGSPEIQKIYKAIENNRPIEWVRVHNLPDLAYFNHAQHTNVAGLACENCHGKIEEMEVVQQRAPLTMGWCINCHRQTVVEHAKDNAYYDRLLEYHGKMRGNEPMTVEQIGGLECSKCHY